MPKSRLDTLKDFMESPPGTNCECECEWGHEWGQKTGNR